MTQSIESMKETIAAQAAVIDRLREALIYAHDEAASLFKECTGEDFNAPLINEALAIPTDSTQILDEVRKQEREKCAKVCETQYPYSVHHTDQRAATNCAAAIRAMEE